MLSDATARDHWSIEICSVPGQDFLLGSGLGPQAVPAPPPGTTSAAEHLSVSLVCHTNATAFVPGQYAAVSEAGARIEALQSAYLAWPALYEAGGGGAAGRAHAAEALGVSHADLNGGLWSAAREMAWLYEALGHAEAACADWPEVVDLLREGYPAALYAETWTGLWALCQDVAHYEACVGGEVNWYPYSPYASECLAAPRWDAAAGEWSTTVQTPEDCPRPSWFPSAP